MTKEMKVLVSLAVLALVGAGCDRSSSSATGGYSTVAQLSDEESAAALTSLSQGQIELGQRMDPLGANSDVIEFARDLVDTYGQARANVQTTIETQGLTAQRSAVSDAISSDIAGIETVLDSSVAGEYDPAFMNSQVAMHRQALLLLDCAILPGLQNEGFKSYVSETLRPQVRAKFEESTRVLTMLSRRNSGESDLEGAVTLSTRAFSCSDVCDPATPNGFSVGLREAACTR